MVPTAVSGTHRAFQLNVPNLTTQTWTLSAYLKPSGYNNARLMVSDGTESDQARAIFNLTDGTIINEANNGTTLSLVSSSATAVGSGWYRCSITVSASSAEPFISAWVFSADNSGTSFTGDGTSGTLVWGAQLELGSVATTYQPITDVNAEALALFPNATLYQDSAGTTLVTTPGQPVGLMLDKSRGLALGPELVVNGDFSDGTTTGWTAGTAVSTAAVVDGEMQVTAVTNNGRQVTAIATEVGKTYKVTGIGRFISGAGVTTGAALYHTTNTGATTTAGPVNSATTNAPLGLVFTATATTSYIAAITLGSTGAIAAFDNISVKELPGNHAVQATGANRPNYGIEPQGGRRNLLTFTEQFDNAVWTNSNVSVTANVAASPDGTSNADALAEAAVNTAHNNTSPSVSVISGQSYTASVYLKKGNGSTAPDWVQLSFGSAGFGASQYANFNLNTGLVGGVSGGASTISSVGNGWFRCSFTATATATATSFVLIGFTNNLDAASRLPNYTGVTTSNVFLWGAQLETGSTATAYQRVTDQYNVTEAGVSSVSYLFFNGSNFSMATSTITPGTDKAQVFAGVRKLSDAARGMIVEAGTGTTETGYFHIDGPRTTATGNYAFRSVGNPNSAIGDAIGATFTAPTTNVLAGLGDISGDRSTLRVNGTQVAQSTSDQGTGNYLAYPLYIGARNGSSLFFSGHLYSLIARFGPNLTSTLTTAPEAWVAGKTGVVIA
jgi:hypothetical protein